MCYLGVGTTPLKRGVNPPQSESALFKIEQYVSSAVSGSNENPGESETAETANGVFEDTADGIMVLSLMSIAAALLESPRISQRRFNGLIPSLGSTYVQVVSCGWKAQPLFCTDANMWLVRIQWRRQ
jgi:hypothetical protein